MRSDLMEIQCRDGNDVTATWARELTMAPGSFRCLSNAGCFRHASTNFYPRCEASIFPSFSFFRFLATDCQQRPQRKLLSMHRTRYRKSAMFPFQDYLVMLSRMLSRMTNLASKQEACAQNASSIFESLRSVQWSSHYP